jgi:hypothetical protein
MKNLFLFSVLLFFSVQGFTQYKYEKEMRINRVDAPENAQRFVDSMDFDSRVRWYKEIGYNRTSYEAKTKHKGERYSIEFSADGTFEDIEIEIEPTDIPSDAFANITKIFETEYESFNLVKLQVQYTGDPGLMLGFFPERDPTDGIHVHFEIIISTKVDGSFQKFEYLFTETGDLVHKSKILLQNTDNLTY